MRAILTYHSIDDSGSPISVSQAAFASHVAWLSSGHVRVLPLHDLLRGPDSGDNAVALTFDDAFENFGTNAWPLLRDRALPVTVFVVTQQVGRTNAWGGRTADGIPTLPLLDWASLDRLRAEGVDLGGHTRTHPRLSTLGAGHTADEVAGCAHDLQARFGAPPRAFAYPYGEAPAVARRVVRETFECGCTTDYRHVNAESRPDALPRLDMYYFQRPGALQRFGSTIFHAQIASRRAARAVRAAWRRPRATR